MRGCEYMLRENMRGTWWYVKRTQRKFEFGPFRLSDKTRLPIFWRLGRRWCRRFYTGSGHGLGCREEPFQDEIPRVGISGAQCIAVETRRCCIVTILVGCIAGSRCECVSSVRVHRGHVPGLYLKARVFVSRVSCAMYGDSVRGAAPASWRLATASDVACAW